MASDELCLGDKRELRKALLRRRDALSEAEQVRAEILITERILGHQWFYGSSQILCFASHGSEIRTGQILEEAVRKGKKVYLPRVEGEKMQFYLYDPSRMVSGYKGILEPSGETERYEYSGQGDEKTLLIMPGVGFDPYRNRIGYGKGFYDRFLQDKPELLIRSIAIGHKCQMVEELPCGEYDQKPYQIIVV